RVLPLNAAPFVTILPVWRAPRFHQTLAHASSKWGDHLMHVGRSQGAAGETLRVLGAPASSAPGRSYPRMRSITLRLFLLLLALAGGGALAAPHTLHAQDASLRAQIARIEDDAYPNARAVVNVEDTAAAGAPLTRENFT